MSWRPSSTRPPGVLTWGHGEGTVSAAAGGSAFGLAVLVEDQGQRALGLRYGVESRVTRLFHRHGPIPTWWGVERGEAR